VNLNGRKILVMSDLDAYEAASDFQPLEGEANFPPTITKEVVGGAHIAPECITRQGNEFVMVVWPNGLPRHETERTVRFPHGLMRFGETMDQCAERLVAAQLGIRVSSVRVLEIDSYVDDANHWHIEPLLLLEVTGEPHTPPEASHVVRFQGSELPDGAVWSEKSFKRVYAQYLA
jgi:8-oxo-dGTP pyrophosphatase MutT (NUDIX family)